MSREIVYDTIHRVVVDSVHVPMDTVLTLNAFAVVEDFYYKAFYTIIGVFLAMIAYKFYIDYREVKKQAKEAADEAVNSVKQEFEQQINSISANLEKNLKTLKDSVVTPHLSLGTTFYSRNAVGKALEQFYLALNSFVSIGIENNEKDLESLEAIVFGISQNYKAANKKNKKDILNVVLSLLKETLSMIEPYNTRAYQKIKKTIKDLIEEIKNSMTDDSLCDRPKEVSESEEVVVDDEPENTHEGQ